MTRLKRNLSPSGAICKRCTVLASGLRFGKSKGQFYTPAEVSRILSKVVGIEHAKAGETTLYDPACGSGSLLIRAAESAPVDVAIYGQEKEGTTAGLARMNLVLHYMA